MYGIGVVKGLLVTLKRFVETYVDDIKRGKDRYYTKEGIVYRSSAETRGLFTVQYPEEKLIIPEEFRFIPFLVYEEKDGEREVRCTSCGICAKVCPTQCIWIERTTDSVTKRPVPDPKNFYIDVDICMNCGLCAEYCPFDAIKMGHDFELSVYDRHSNNIYDKEKLLKPVSYYQSIRPSNYEREEKARAEAEAAKAAKAAARQKGKG